LSKENGTFRGDFGRPIVTNGTATRSSQITLGEDLLSVDLSDSDSADAGFVTSTVHSNEICIMCYGPRKR